MNSKYHTTLPESFGVGQEFVDWIIRCSVDELREMAQRKVCLFRLVNAT